MKEHILTIVLTSSVTTLIVQLLVAWILAVRRVARNKAALRAEIVECGRCAREFLNPESGTTVRSPLYRLPVLFLQTSLPILLQAGALSKSKASAIIRFYSEVETFNRGLDEAASQLTPGGVVGADTKNETHSRNKIKAERIAGPIGADRVAGEYYSAAMNAAT